MPGKPGLTHLHGERLLDSLALRKAFLAALRDGHTRSSAAQLLDIDRSTVYRYAREHPDFAAEMEDAEADTVEAAYKVLMEIMVDEEVSKSDRISAADKLIRHRGREKTPVERKVTYEHQHQLVAPDLDGILELQRRLDERRELEAATIEGTIIEEDDNE